MSETRVSDRLTGERQRSIVAAMTYFASGESTNKAEAYSCEGCGTTTPDGAWILRKEEYFCSDRCRDKYVLEEVIDSASL